MTEPDTTMTRIGNGIELSQQQVATTHVTADGRSCRNRIRPGDADGPMYVFRSGRRR